MSVLTIREKINFLEDAFKEASSNLSSNNGGPFGAVIVDLNKKEIIGRGHNQVVQNNDPTCHAEIMAIRDACKNINNYVLNNTALFTTCYPCPMCMSAIFWARIDEIYYSGTSYQAKNIDFDDLKIYDYIARIVNPIKEQVDILRSELDVYSHSRYYEEYKYKNKIIKNILPEMNEELFDLWLKKENKVKY